MASTVCHVSSTIHRLWWAFGLQPHGSKSFKVSSDHFFVEEARNIVALYQAPPERAQVLCVDKNSRAQALIRAQSLPHLHASQPKRRGHDYTRHGTSVLLEALDMATAVVIGLCVGRYRAK